MDTCITISRSGRRPTYAQWITKAIASSPSKALTLADINEWMIRNVPGLQELRYLHSCKGWKNAVRHTLSINRHRFKKVTRDGKPSLWSLVNDDLISDGATIESTIGADLREQNAAATVLKCSAEAHNETAGYVSPRSEGKPKSAESADHFAQPQRVKAEKDNQQALNHSQTLEILYADGVSGTIILPSPLPISNLNFGGLLLNSMAPSVIPVTTVGSCSWLANSNFELARRMSMNDMANFRDLVKSNAFIV